MKRNKILLGAAAVVLAALTSCGGGQQGLPTSNGYPVTTIGASNAQLKTTYPATIKGVQDVEVRPKVSGFITKLYVHEGQAVRAGQVLFELDHVTYDAAVRQARASVNSAKSSVNQAKAGLVQATASANSANAQAATARLTYNNSKSLYQNKVIGDYELQTSRNSYETAMAAVRQAQSGIASAKAAVRQAEAGVKQAEASLMSAKENLSFCYVKSPATGVIGSLPFKEGALVSPSSAQPVTTVSNISTMEVYFSMTEADILDLTKANGGIQNAISSFPEVNLQLADGSTYSVPGRVVKMSGVIDPTTGTVSVIARFANPQHLLKSGGAGQIVIAKSNNNALVIPQDATSQVQDKIFVYKVDANNHVHYSEITVDPQNDGKNYIVTSGLKMGDKIVAKGLSSLTDGQEIKPMTLAEYNEEIKKAQQLGEKQSSAGGFVDAMKGDD